VSSAASSEGALRIVVTAYAQLGSLGPTNEPKIAEIANVHGKNASLLGTLPNIDIFDFSLVEIVEVGTTEKLINLIQPFPPTVSFHYACLLAVWRPHNALNHQYHPFKNDEY